MKKVQHQSKKLAQSIRLTQLVSQQLDATIITCWSVSKSQDILVLESVQLKPKNEWTKIADKGLRNFADCGVNFFVAEVAETFCHCLELSLLAWEVSCCHCIVLSAPLLSPLLCFCQIGCGPENYLLHDLILICENVGNFTTSKWFTELF